jgi:hypothetical protein
MQFPAGLALGEAFYNRNQERSMLKTNINNGIHTVLIAPRRFGKTSLLRKVIDENELPFIWLDFMAITSKEDTQNRFLTHIGELIIKIAKTETRLKALLTRYFSHFKPEISVGIPGFLKVTLKAEDQPSIGLTEALLNLDRLAEETKTRVVIVCDEFQEITQIDRDTTLQASIRHAAERSQSTTYLFSGSKHKPLSNLFNGKQNPLYELCDQMTIARISEEDYRYYLQKEAKKKWDHPLNEVILKKIFTYTDFYPKYVNALCAKIWFSEVEPTPELVDHLWEEYVFARRSVIADLLNDLTLNQRKLLRYLCYYPTNAPFSHEVSVSSNLSVSAIQSALPQLIDRDLVVEVDGAYRVLDPTFKHYFKIF